LPSHPTWIHPQRRPIPHIPAEVDIAGGEAEGVFAEEPAGAGVVPAGAVEVEAGGWVPFPTGVGEPGLELAVRLADDLAERVVADVVDDRRRAGGGGVLDQVADGAEVVAEAPGDGSSRTGGAGGDLFVGQDLVGRWAVEVAVGEGVGRSRERQDQVFAVVDEPLRRFEDPVAVGIDLSRDPSSLGSLVFACEDENSGRPVLEGDAVQFWDHLNGASGCCVTISLRSAPDLLVELGLRVKWLKDSPTRRN
jgi:hypothetical protein